MDSKNKAVVDSDFQRRLGEVLLNRKVMTNPKNLSFFAALFTDFVPVGIKDIGQDRLVYTGCSRQFRQLADGEKTPRYKLHVSMSPATGGAWKCRFEELGQKPESGFFCKLFRWKKKEKGK